MCSLSNVGSLGTLSNLRIYKTLKGERPLAQRAGIEILKASDFINFRIT